MINVSNIARTEQVATYLRLIAKWWWLPIVFGLGSAALIYVSIKYTSKPIYGSDVTMVVNSPGAGSLHVVNDAASYAVLITTGPVLDRAAKTMDAVGRRDPSSLYSARCAADGNDIYLTCSSRGRDYRAVAANLNHLADTFIKFVSNQQSSQYESSLSSLRRQELALRKEVSGLQKRLATLQSGGHTSVTDQYQITALQSQITQDQTSLSQLAVQESQAQQQLGAVESAVRVVDPAVASSADLGQSPKRNAILGFIIGFAIGVALIVLLEYLDDTFRSIDEVGEVTGLSILGAVRPYEQARENALAAWRKLHSGVAEAYRVVRTNIQFTAVDNPPRVLTITSAREGEGKSTTSINLAIAMALAHQRILLVDADLRRHGLSSRFGYQGLPGLSNALVDPSVKVGVAVDEIPNLTIVPAGPIPPNPAELLGSERMNHWLSEQMPHYDLVILDTPPILSVADSRILASHADGVVMMVDPTLSSRRLVKQARLALETVGTRVLGVIVNKATFYSQDSYYKYYYYYDKYDTAPRQSPIAAAATVSERRPAADHESEEVQVR